MTPQPTRVVRYCTPTLPCSTVSSGAVRVAMPLIGRAILCLLVQAAKLACLVLPCLSFNLRYYAARKTSLIHDASLSTSHHVISARRQRSTTPIATGRWRTGASPYSIVAMGAPRAGGNSFRTEVDVSPWPSHTHVGYEDSFLLLGSCFSQNVGARLERAKMNSMVNPSHGLLFSPLSAAASLDRMLSGVPYDDSEPGVVFSEGTGLWSSLYHHSTFSSTSRRACIEGMNLALAKGRDNLLSATCIFLTLGTAWVFRHRELNADVANCHKLPAYSFERRIVPVDEIAASLHKSISNILRANPQARIILTVSPVRHWRDGPVENSRSKAHLLAGVHGAIELLREEGIGGGGLGGPGHVSYFPSYEIVNDDLRDYRFYEADMVHPNTVAADYIWNKLVETMFSDEAIRTMGEIEKVMQAKEHRPFNPRSDAHQRFLRAQLDKLDTLESRHPSLALDEERAFFQSQVLEPATSPSG